MAAMCLALAKLPKLGDPLDDARRLFVADGLISDGIDVRDIWTALEFDPTPLDELGKYNTNEPRVPSGSGKPSGEWTNGGSPASSAAAIAGIATRVAVETAEAAEARAPQILARLPGVAADIALLGLRLNLPLSALIETLRSTPTGGAKLVGSVVGFPSLQYSRHQDETALNVVSASDGSAIFTLYPTRVRGQYATPDGVIVASMENDELALRAGANATSRAKDDTDEPQLCPEPPVPDKKGMPGASGDRARGYVAFMKPLINPPPGEPTPLGMGYGLRNPVTGNLIVFDDCQKSSGILIDYKGLAYAGMFQSSIVRASITKKLSDEATNQVRASGGRTIVWYFAELPAMEYVQETFRRNPLLARIEFQFAPWPEGEKWRWRGGEWRRLARIAAATRNRWPTSLTRFHDVRPRS